MHSDIGNLLKFVDMFLFLSKSVHLNGHFTQRLIPFFTSVMSVTHILYLSQQRIFQVRVTEKTDACVLHLYIFP